MKQKKIFILLPDGVGLRNFAYTDFQKQAKENKLDIVFWNNSSFDLKSLGFDEIKINNSKTHFLTDVLKKARVQIDLNLNIKRFNDEVYESYRFRFATNSLIAIIKTFSIRVLTFLFSTTKGIKKIRKAIFNFEKKTTYYKDCLEVLKNEKPDFVFCTNQRTTLALAPILAAQELNIPTGTFIFSWDNLPKATKIVETDFYFVWSEHMKREMLFYYPYINENQIKITGTPQFEPHFDKNLLQSKESFFKEYRLEINKKYICFSGDDITSSPYDPQFLEDTAIAVKELNKKGYNIGIIFRRCPVDFSNRFEKVLTRNEDIITSISPKWEKIGSQWNTIIPTKEDLALLINTIFHTEMVVNLGSSMVFDYVAHNKPCAYFNYNISNGEYPLWSVEKIYKLIHFRSMPNKKSVFWIDSPHQIESILEEMVQTTSQSVVKYAQEWFEKINQHPPQLASERIWNEIIEICIHSN